MCSLEKPEYVLKYVCHIFDILEKRSRAEAFEIPQEINSKDKYSDFLGEISTVEKWIAFVVQYVILHHSWRTDGTKKLLKNIAKHLTMSHAYKIDFSKVFYLMMKEFQEIV